MTTRRQLLMAATLPLIAGSARGADIGTERSLVKEVTVAASLDDTWAAWTTREGITSFFAPDARVDARPGGTFEVYFDPGAEPGLRGADGMQFMALQPRQMLSFTWNAPPHLAQARQQRTLVILRFEALGERSTRVRLLHVGWGSGGEWDASHAYFDRAWGAVLGNLKKRFDSGPVDWKPWLEDLDKARSQRPS